jgi:hypothetical protein
MGYRVLALDPNSQHMSLAVLRKIRDLVNAGAVVVGSKPIESPSQADDQMEFKTIADQLWGERDPVRGRSQGIERQGRGLLSLSRQSVEPSLQPTDFLGGTTFRPTRPVLNSCRWIRMAVSVPLLQTTTPVAIS